MILGFGDLNAQSLKKVKSESIGNYLSITFDKFFKEWWTSKYPDNPIKSKYFKIYDVKYKPGDSSITDYLVFYLHDDSTGVNFKFPIKKKLFDEAIILSDFDVEKLKMQEEEELRKQKEEELKKKQVEELRRQRYLEQEKREKEQEKREQEEKLERIKRVEEELLKIGRVGIEKKEFLNVVGNPDHIIYGKNLMEIPGKIMDYDFNSIKVYYYSLDELNQNIANNLFSNRLEPDGKFQSPIKEIESFFWNRYFFQNDKLIYMDQIKKK